MLSQVGLSAALRLELAAAAVEGEALAALGAWEAQQPGFVDFPEVARALQVALAGPTVFYACGTDHAEKCGLHQGGLYDLYGIGVVVVPRLGEADASGLAALFGIIQRVLANAHSPQDSTRTVPDRATTHHPFSG